MIGAVVIAGQQPPAAGAFTAAQASAGQQAYTTSCASCHMPDLRGNNEAPALSGQDFMNTWRTRQARELVEFIQGAMPPAGPRLPAEQYLAITAYILQANGGRAGAQPLAADRGYTNRRDRNGAGAERAAAAARGGTSRRGPGRRRSTAPGIRPDRRRRSAELRPGDRRDAAQSATRRLADDPAQLPGVEPQPADGDHARQRRAAASSPGCGR